MNTEILDLEENHASGVLPNDKRAKQAKMAFYMLFGAGVLVLLAIFYQLNFLSDLKDHVFVSDEDLERSDSIVAITNILYSVLNLVCVVLFLKWMRRLYANGARANLKMRSHDNMVIWGFVIPIVSFYRPYQLMMEILSKMDSVIKRVKHEFVRTSPEGVAGLWWVMFIVKTILSQIQSVYARYVYSVDDYYNNSIYILILTFIDLMAILTTIFMISKVSEEESIFKECVEEEMGEESAEELELLAEETL